MGRSLSAASQMVHPGWTEGGISCHLCPNTRNRQTVNLYISSEKVRIFWQVYCLVSFQDCKFYLLYCCLICVFIVTDCVFAVVCYIREFDNCCLMVYLSCVVLSVYVDLCVWEYMFIYWMLCGHCWGFTVMVYCALCRHLLWLYMLCQHQVCQLFFCYIVMAYCVLCRCLRWLYKPCRCLV